MTSLTEAPVLIESKSDALEVIDGLLDELRAHKLVLDDVLTFHAANGIDAGKLESRIRRTLEP